MNEESSESSRHIDINNSPSQSMFSDWDEFIDWQKRREGENEFFENILDNAGAKEIFDASLGSGFHTIALLEKRFKVSSNEIDPDYVRLARQNAGKLGLELIISHYDWREIPQSLKEKYDAVICLGNSFTFMKTEEDQRKAIQHFADIVKPGGLVIVDHRNYDYMLLNRDFIVQNPINFIYSRRFYYCSNEILGYPIRIAPNEVIFEYKNIREKRLLGNL